MSAGAAQVQAFDRRTMVRPARHGTHQVQLVEGHVAMVRMPARQRELTLHVDGGPRLGVDDVKALHEVAGRIDMGKLAALK